MKCFIWDIYDLCDQQQGIVRVVLNLFLTGEQSVLGGT